MIVRRHSILVLTIALTFWTQHGSTKGERWSRQVLNSEWIPLANPRSLQGGGVSLGGNVAHPSVGNTPQLQPVVLPPVLREQYHQQLLQLQETQESIQKLLQLQQQLRAQQQLLQAQSYLPEGFSTDEERKSALHQTTIANIQSLPQFAPGALLPPPPGNQPQPPEFAAQDFLVTNPQKKSQNGQIRQNQETAGYNVNAERQNGDRRGENLSTEDLSKTRDYKNPKQLRDNQNSEQLISPTTPGSVEVQNDGEEEVQLLYVPAETLAQRDQQQKTQRVRNRKQYSSQQQQQQVNRQQNRYQQQPTSQQAEDFQSQGLEGTRPSAAQQNFANQVLYQLQQEQAIRTRIQQEERDKELTRLRNEQQELDRQAKLHQELVFKEQDLRRQKELALRKELERQEEEAKQKELQRIKELNQRKLLEEEAARKKEAERQEELERQKIAEIRAQDRHREETEARRAEIDRLAALERQKELEIQKSIEQQRELERQQAEDEARARAQLEAQHQAQAQLEAHRKAHQDAIDNQKQAQIDAARLDAQNRAQNQAQQQHLTETTRPKSQRLKSRQRQRNRQENQSTTPSPNQPPLSVYMGSINRITNPADLRVSDVLTILKDAKTISVLDTVGPDTPQVFVGPTNLEPPSGYAKFDLPYLSAIDNNRVERKVDKLPFFVAPLSFKPPPGYSKIPFPAPHIGSVVVNTLDNEPHSLDDPLGGILKTDEDLRPSPTPLIEPNSYVEDAQLPAGNPYSQFSTPGYSQEALVATTTPKYETSYSTTPSSGTRYRHRQFYSDRSPHVVSTALYQDHSSTEPGIGTRTKFRQYFKEEQGHETSNDNNGSTPSPQDNLQPDISAVNGEEQISQHGDVTERYNAQSVSDQQLVRNPFSDLSQGHIASELYNTGESQGPRSDFGGSQNRENQFVRESEDRRLSSGPTQYTIPSEFPRISPQLPGLVNSLIGEQEIVEKSAAPLTSTTTTTTTTTTTEPSTTTYRSRGRQRGRIVPTRAPTTTETAPTKSPVVDRSRRPYSRSRVRQGYPTTTETYQETIYEPTRPKLSATQEKTHYSATGESQRTSSPRSQRYRGRGSDRNAVQPEARPDAGLSEVEHNPQSQEVNHANDPLRHSLQEPNAPVQNTNAPVYREDGFLSAPIPSQNDGDKLTSDAQPLQGTVSDTAITNDNENPAFSQNPNYGQSNVEQSPVNGFNYQSRDNKFENLPETTVAPPQYTGNSFNGQRPQNAEQIYSFHGIHAEDSAGKPNINNFQNSDLNREQIYGSQDSGNRHSVPDSDILKSDSPGQDADDRPVYDHLKDENTDFLQATSTTTKAPEITTPRPILTPAPLIVRQRPRGRLNQNAQRVHHVDSPIQTRPSGSRDEFVRFSAVNQDHKQHSSPGRIHSERTRSRIRNRGRNDQSNLQTEGNDYVRIQSPVQRPTTTTTTTTTTEPPPNYPKDTEEEIEYGFIRPPSFKPIHPVNIDRPVGNVAPTYRTKYEQVQQTEEPTNDAPVEVNTPQSQTLKNRQKYHVMNRRPLTRVTTASPPLTSTSTETRVEEVYTVKPKAQNDELTKGSKNRGRIRRPGKRRTTTTSTTTTTTTTTTESILDSSNELPLDENYPQIIQGLPALSDQPRRTLFDEELKSPNLEALPQAVALQRPTQLHSFQNQENQQFPRQEFVLNFGIGSEQDKTHEEYDQTQLASSHQQKYKHPNRGSSHSHPADIPVADIEGAESQWSTKLTHSSFQPSTLLNQLHSGAKSNERQEKSDDSFDIITAGPELASADDLVTGNNSSAPRDIVVNTSYLGNAKKEGLEIKETWEKPILQGRSIVEEKNETFKDDSGSLDSLQFWNNGQDQKISQENLKESSSQTKNEADLNPGNRNGDTMIPRITEEALNPVTDLPKTESNDATSLANSEISGEPTTTKRSIQRRRRVRIRVRPAEDFVSAESQHVSSVWNSLISEKQNYEKTGGFNDYKTTTTITPTSSTTETKMVKSFLDELLDEMDKNNDERNSTTTNVPDNTESSKISEEIDAREVDTTTTTRRPDFAGENSPTTISDDVTTLRNEKFVTEAATEYHNYSPKSEEKKKIFRPNEPILEQSTNQFDSFQPQKNWWNHNYDAVTKFPQSKPEKEVETITTKIVMDRQESPSESTTIANVQEQDTESGHSLSDYVDAFFKTMEGQEDQKAEETERTSDYGFQLSDSKKKQRISAKEDKDTNMTLKTVSEDQKGNVSGLVKSSTVYDVEEVAKEKKVTKMEDELTSKKVDEIREKSEQDVTTNFAPMTTPEVPYSPEELTTEMPGVTTTVKPKMSANQFAKVLRTSTTTEISHMTEICYRGRCVKSKSQKEIKRR